MKKLLSILILTSVFTIANAQKPELKKEYYDIAKLKSTGYTVPGGGFSGPTKVLEWKYYYENGNIQGKEIYDKNGTRNGTWYVYQPNGDVKRKEIYGNNGAPTSTWFSYYPGGNIKDKEVYETNGYKSDFQEFYENGKTKSKGKRSKRGEKTGEWVYYYENGNILKQGKFSDKENLRSVKYGSWNYYYENGVLSQTGSFKNGQKTGVWEAYHENGKILWKAIYYKDEPVEYLLHKDQNGNDLSMESLYIDEDAQFKLAIAYYNGEGVEEDNEKAFKWMLKAAENGKPDAYFQLAMLYGTGTGVQQNITKAIYWYKKVTDYKPEVAKAQYRLAAYYINGDGVEQDYGLAFEHMLKAAENDYTGAYYNVGLFYSLGQGVQLNEEKAIYWYKKAIDDNPDNAAALHNLGVQYVNRGYQISESADKVPNEEENEYERLIKEANANFEKAIPYLEKYMELKPENEDTKGLLDQLYEQTKMKKKKK